MERKFDVIIIGAGPAGIFAALELIRLDSNINVVILEKGSDLESRISKVKEREFKKETIDPVFCGWGGAGAFSDGKLNLSRGIGGILDEYIEADELDSLIDYVDNIYIEYGAPEEIYGCETDKVKILVEDAAKYDLKLIPFKIRHLGTDRCAPLLKNISDDLIKSTEIKFDTEVEDILVEDKRVVGVSTKSGEKFYGDYIIVSPGRGGASWLNSVARKINLNTLTNPVDIGVRIELPASIMKHLTDICYESKFLFYSKKFDDHVRTFCMNPYGEVVREYNNGMSTVNGHSYSTHRSENTNFAILVRTIFTEPFHEPISYGEYIARLANLLGNTVVIQRLGDLMHGRRSTYERINRGIVKPTLHDATPGDLSFVIPYRFMQDILEMIESLDKIAPGVNSRHTLIYGMEVKFYSQRITLNKDFETEIANLFAVGDGAGITRGLVQASVSGVVAARGIFRKEEKMG
ncbi:MAG: NAD(P)/FAD-dependent oxidoreductase [Nitrospirota bacterium]